MAAKEKEEFSDDKVKKRERAVLKTQHSEVQIWHLVRITAIDGEL